VAIASVVGVASVAGCGSLTSGSGGDTSVAPVTISVTTLPSTTTSTEPTTSIEFDRPIVEGTDPLAADADPAAIAELVDDMRGRTDNVARQMRRLGPFPDPIPSPQLAQIVDVEVLVEPERDDLHLAVTTVRYRVPYEGPVVETFLEDALRSVGWIRLDERDASTDDVARLQRTYRQPGQRGNGVEFVIEIETGNGPTVVEQTQTASTPDAALVEDGDTYLERLSAWTDALPLPGQADLASITVSTADDRLTLEARHLLDVEDISEAAEDVLDAAEEDWERNGTVLPLELVRSEDSLPLTVSFTDSRDDEPIVIISTTTLPLTPLD
jgi:hypothetical protein